jgi:hypothetical protein
MRVARGALTIAATLALVTACSSSKDKKDPKGEVSDLSGLFTDGKPVVPAMFGKHDLALGMTYTAAEEAAPAFSSGSLQTKEYAGARFGWDAHEDSRGIYSLYVELKLEPAEAQAMLTAKWGEAKQGSDLDGDRWYWFNAGSRIRVVLYKNRLGWMHTSFERYMPLADMLGKHEAMLGWETKPIFGMSGETVNATYPQFLKGIVADEEGTAPESLLLPGSEYADSTSVVLNYRDDVVTGVQFLLSADAYPAGIDELLEVFKSKYGEPKAAEQGKAVIYKDNPMVRVERVENGLNVLVVEAPEIELE